MARIRTIKPDFFTSKDIVNMTPLARLFYASLWCEADREGRLKWDLETLKLRYLPADDCDIESIAAELIEGGQVIVYEVDGKHYAEIPTFKEHQIINNREAESVIPARRLDASQRPLVGREGKGKEGKGSRERDTFDASQMELPDLINKTYWVQWCEFRRAKRKSISEQAAKLQIALLSKYDQQAQAQIISKSIQNDYQGLFEPDGGPPSQAQAAPTRRLKPL